MFKKKRLRTWKIEIKKFEFKCYAFFATKVSLFFECSTYIYEVKIAYKVYTVYVTSNVESYLKLTLYSTFVCNVNSRYL